MKKLATHMREVRLLPKSTGKNFDEELQYLKNVEEAYSLAIYSQ